MVALFSSRTTRAFAAARRSFAFAAEPSIGPAWLFLGLGTTRALAVRSLCALAMRLATLRARTLRRDDLARFGAST